MSTKISRSGSSSRSGLRLRRRRLWGEQSGISGGGNGGANYDKENDDYGNIGEDGKDGDNGGGGRKIIGNVESAVYGMRIGGKGSS